MTAKIHTQKKTRTNHLIFYGNRSNIRIDLNGKRMNEKMSYTLRVSTVNFTFTIELKVLK